MDQAPLRLPVSLRVVAWLFILSGVLVWWGVLTSVLLGKPNFPLPGVLELFAGVGLLRLRPGWRTCALVLLWISIVLSALMAIALLAGTGSAPVHLNGHLAARVPAAALSLLAFAQLGFSLWQVSVLCREDVRALFGLKEGPQKPQQNFANEASAAD